MRPFTDEYVEAKFALYPSFAQSKLLALQSLIIKTAEQLGINDVQEALKWGEPAYLKPQGTTIRIDWKPRNPEYYALYVSCRSNLINTFKEQYGDLFLYEKTRALLFHVDDELPEEISDCIGQALTYKKHKKN